MSSIDNVAIGSELLTATRIRRSKELTVPRMDTMPTATQPQSFPCAADGGIAYRGGMAPC